MTNRDKKIQDLRAQVDALLGEIETLTTESDVPKPKSKKRRRKAVTPDIGGRHADVAAKVVAGDDPVALRLLAAQLRAEGRFREATNAVYHAIMLEQGALKKR